MIKPYSNLYINLILTNFFHEFIYKTMFHLLLIKSSVKKHLKIKINTNKDMASLIFTNYIQTHNKS